MSKLRRDRAFDGETEIQSKLPDADAPQSRTVAGGEVNADLLRAAELGGLDGAVNQIVCDDAATVLCQLPDGCVTCAITSPPYWNLVDYGFPDQIGADSYDRYRHRLRDVWQEVSRCLAPNGKFCLNVPIMPLRKAVSIEHFGKTHTRLLLDLPGDLKADIFGCTDLRYYSLYIWEKQTTEKMFGSYPHPPNLYERNYLEFILVFVKPGKPPKHPKDVKAAAKLTSEEWMELTKQLWWIYPANVRRKEGHPAPFPEALPNRLISMYTFPAAGSHPGDIVLDPFAGWGTTCVAAKRLGRRFVGLDGSPAFCQEAIARLADVTVEPRVMPATRPEKPKPAEPEESAKPAGFIRKLRQADLVE